MEQNILIGAFSLTQKDLELIEKKYYRNSNAIGQVVNLCTKVGIDEGRFNSMVSLGVDQHALLRCLTLLAVAALEGGFAEKQIYGYRVSVHGTDNCYDISDPVFVEIDGVCIFRISQNYRSDYLWTIDHIMPHVAYNDDIINAVLYTCAA